MLIDTSAKEAVAQQARDPCNAQYTEQYNARFICNCCIAVYQAYIKGKKIYAKRDVGYSTLE